MAAAEIDRPGGARAAAKPGINSHTILVSAMALLLFGHTQFGQSEAKPLRQANGSPKARQSAQEDLRTAMTKVKFAAPYRLTDIRSTEEHGRSTSETSVLEYVSADRLRVTLRGKDGKRTEMIIIGGTNYQFSDGKWTKEPEKHQEDVRSQDSTSLPQSDVKFIGVETLNGIEYKVYTYRWSLVISVSGKFPTGTGKAWIGVRDGLPHQIDTDLNIEGYHTESHTVYEYDVKIDIQRPIP